MPRLTKSEIAEHRGWLSEWRTPAAMAAYVSDVNDAMTSAVFFVQGGVEFLRDAWLAAEFGRHRRSSSVRLVPAYERWPDFEAQSGGLTKQFECAEADIPGRRRSNEYRLAQELDDDGQPRVEFDSPEDWIARADQVPAALAAVIANKVGRRYSSRVSLLVYLNISEFDIRKAEIEGCMAPAVAPALASFQHVWILWKTRLYGPWSG